MNLTSRLSCTTALTVGLAVATPLWAQSTAAPGAPAGSSATGSQTSASAQPGSGSGAVESEGVADIVVTAQKRSESLSRVGLTVSALSGDQMKAQGIVSVADLAKVTPGLTYANSANNTPVYTLRGVGFYETSLAAYPDVSVYVDEVGLPFPVLATQASLDPERVEVLKGPQGTLFGQNATGGAINFVAAKPTDKFAAGGDLSYGRFDTFSGNAYISGPISDTLKARLAVKAEHGEEWQKSYTTNDKLGKSRVLAGRLLLDWDPAPTVRFRLNLNGSIDKSDPQAAQYIEYFPQNVTAFPALANYPFSPRNPRAADWGTGIDRPSGDDKQFQAALRGEFDLTPDITLTSLSSYIHFKRDQVNDPDGMRIQEFTFDVIGKIDSYSQELRLANGSDNRFRWIVGGNVEHSKVDDFNVLRVNASTSAASLGIVGNNFFSNQRMTNLAGFANGDFDVNDQITLKAGVRYTSSKRKNTSCTLDNGDGLTAALLTSISSALRGTPTPPIPPGGCINLGPDNLPGLFQDKLNEDNISWRAGIDYKPSSTALIYFNVSKGYKAGSFPTATASSDVQFAPVVQESVLDYEGGVKLQLFDRRISLTAAGFYYDYKNKQLRSKIIDPVFGVLDALVNIPKSKVKGGEVSITARPVQGLTMSGSATYLDAEITRYSGINGAGQAANFAGFPVPFAPKWQIAGSMDYTFPLSETLNATFGGNVNYNASTYAVVGRDPASKIDSYTLLDVRAGFETADGRYRLTFWGRNITNTYYWTNAAVVNDAKVRFAGRPATYGATFGFRY
ncbi:TonB-dependent receptor [Sphingomonas sp. ID0503]|uniref:TonB-dependent receptor n=1 Tax=Sphingomonas sp. ID0503 TaxID=3399691 RepID=UPI003AFAC26A